MALSRPLRLATSVVVTVVVVVVGLGLGACGDDDPTVDQPVATTVPTTAASTPTTPTTPTTTTPAGRVADYVFQGGEVVRGDSRVTVKVGEQVTIRVVSDVAEEVHVHTYDLSIDLEPNVPGLITFPADIPGVHEVELEHSHLHLLSLEVQ